MGGELDKLKELLGSLQNTEKEMNKFASGLTGGLSMNMENIIKEATVESEKTMKINKKQAKVSLMKDNSLKIVFENSQDAKNFFDGKK